MSNENSGTEQRPITTRIDGRIGILTFHRPRVMNAFDSALIDATNQAMDAFMNDDAVLALIVHGDGRCFSAGFDMTWVVSLEADVAWRVRPPASIHCAPTWF